MAITSLIPVRFKLKTTPEAYIETSAEAADSSILAPPHTSHITLLPADLFITLTGFAGRTPVGEPRSDPYTRVSRLSAVSAALPEPRAI